MPEVLFYIPREQRLRLLQGANKASRGYLIKYLRVLSRERDQEVFNNFEQSIERLRKTLVGDLPAPLTRNLLTSVTFLPGDRMIVGGWS